MELKHNFDVYVDRRNTDSKKYGYKNVNSDVLPMWIADTDFNSPEPVIKTAIDRSSHGLFGYPYNDDEFNMVVKSWMEKRHNWIINQEDVAFVSGVVNGALYTLDAFTSIGDKVVCLTPLFGPLQSIVEDNGRFIVGSSMIEDNGFYSINFEDLEIKLKDPKVKMFILCNPHNPVGRVFSEHELGRIGKLCLDNDVIIFNDEVHADIISSEYKHRSLPSISNDISQITVTGMNPGKTFNVGGIRTAAVIIQNPRMMKKFLISRKKHKGQGRTVFGQSIFISCYRDCEYYVDQMNTYIESNINYAKNYIDQNIKEIKLRKPEGMYLLWLDCRNLNLKQNELMDLFESKGKILMNSGISFGSEGLGFVRLNIAVPRITLEDGMKRIEKAIEYLR